MANRQWYGAIDQGTTSTRFMVFDLSGPQPVKLVKAKRPIPTVALHPGWAEQDPSLMIKSTIECINEVSEAIKSQYGISSLQDCLKGIGVTNQRETTIAWDAVTGQPLSPAILWLDTRTKELLKDIPYGPEHKTKTGLPLSTYFSGPKIRWILENGIVDASNPNLRFGTVDSWISFNLLRGKPHLTDCTNAGRTLMLDIHSLQWDSELCSLFKAKPEWLATTILPNAAQYGLFDEQSAASGVPLTASIGDQHAALVGHGCLDLDCAKLTYGTGCFFMRTIEDAPSAKIDFNALLKTIGFQLDPSKPPKYAVEAPVAAGGSYFSWLRDHMEMIADASEIDKIIRLPDPSENIEDAVYFLPALAGILAPYWNPEARASVHGLSLFTGKHELILAVVESIAFACRQVIELSGQRDISNIHLDGGLTKCKTLLRIQATLMKSPLTLSRESEATALGAAISAYYGAIGTPYNRGPIATDTFQPDSSLFDYYERKYQHWRALMNRHFPI